jgi:predicted deacylase
VAKARAFAIADIMVKPGQRMCVDLPVPGLYTHTPLALPVHVIHGHTTGPTLFVSAAIHGDEINGVEIIRRLLKLSVMKSLKGTLLAVPVVNVFGFLHLSRYLPDRRDLNRSFPGSEVGSGASRLANLFATEIISRSDFGIDLHTGAIHRTNLPQIRANLDDEQTLKLANAFGVPVMINSDIRDGSLRQHAAEKGVPTLLYEAGEALRFDESSIRGGVRGVLSVMREIGMLRATPAGKGRLTDPVVARSSSWVRASISGVFSMTKSLGERVHKGEPIGVIADPFGTDEVAVEASVNGLIIGHTRLPPVHEGDALVHIARFQDPDEAEERVEEFQQEVVGSL